MLIQEQISDQRYISRRKFCQLAKSHSSNMYLIRFIFWFYRKFLCTICKFRFSSVWSIKFWSFFLISSKLYITRFISDNSYKSTEISAASLWSSEDSPQQTILFQIRFWNGIVSLQNIVQNSYLIRFISSVNFSRFFGITFSQ